MCSVMYVLRGVLLEARQAMVGCEGGVRAVVLGGLAWM